MPHDPIVSNTPIVIIGAGEAGTAAAASLRAEGWEGEIILIGIEPHLPYERPPLSKAVMVAQGEPGLPLISTGARFDELAVRYLAGTSVTAIVPAAHEVVLADGHRLAYSKLLLATGANPRRLTLPGGEHVHYLRTFHDALALRGFFQPGKKIVVIGGGFIGLECAASARQMGAHVTLVEAAPRILMRGVPEKIARLIEARHRAEGVEFFIGTGLERIEKNAAGLHLVLKDGTMIAADCILAGIGAAPEVALAEAAGLALDNGVRVDTHLQTSDADIFAAGDCCSFPHPLYGHRRIRLEAWRNAQDQGRIVAANMLGKADHYQAVPWFWSDQYDLHLQIAGLAEGAAVHVERDVGPDACLMFHLDSAGRLLAASGAGPIGKIAKEVRLAEMLVAKGHTLDAAALANPAVKLKSLLAG